MNHQIKHYYWNWFNKPYPKNHEEIAGDEEFADELWSDLPLTDSSAAACIHTYVEQEGRIDLPRVAIIGRCYRDISIAIPNLRGYYLEYFKELESLCRLVLEDISMSDAPATPGKAKH